MLLTKFFNAAGLFWDSLDTRERQMLLGLVAYALAAGMVAAQRGARERFKAEVRAELAAARGTVA